MTKPRLIVTILILLLFTSTIPAKELLDGKMSIDLPEGFKKLSAEMIEAKFPGEDRPTLVYGNSTGSVTVAIRFMVVDLPGNDLSVLKKALRQNIQASRPDANFLVDETVTINGQEWIHFVFVTQAEDGPIRNEMLVAAKDGEIFMLNLNATQSDYKEYSTKLDSTKSSLKLK